MTPRTGTPTDVMAIRRQWARVLAVAGWIDCRRCHKPIRPGDKWELGHPPDKPYAHGNRYDGLAPEHQKCNRTGYVSEQPTFTGWSV